MALVRGWAIPSIKTYAVAQAVGTIVSVIMPHKSVPALWPWMRHAQLVHHGSAFRSFCKLPDLPCGDQAHERVSHGDL